MAEAPEFLYCVADAERLERSPEAVIESFRDEGFTGEITIEKWTVVPTIKHLYGVDDILEFLPERADTVDEGWYHAAERAAQDEGIRLLFQGALNQYASKINYWMADRKVDEVTVTL